MSKYVKSITNWEYQLSTTFIFVKNVLLHIIRKQSHDSINKIPFTGQIPIILKLIWIEEMILCIATRKKMTHLQEETFGTINQNEKKYISIPFNSAVPFLEVSSIAVHTLKSVLSHK